MADAKALLESIGRSFGYHLGVQKDQSQYDLAIAHLDDGWQWCKRISGVFDYAQNMSPLGNASALDCANYCVTLFSDLTRMVTMQNLFHDGGFSAMGINPVIFENKSE